MEVFLPVIHTEVFTDDMMSGISFQIIEWEGRMVIDETRSARVDNCLN